ncbi:hypothetical protein [Galbibacter orientalis]|uniref:tetratricopeptide repeat protein n=1 Tax=Galbibacter orientalis TaxID=453852 RepID=UPI003080F92C
MNKIFFYIIIFQLCSCTTISNSGENAVVVDKKTQDSIIKMYAAECAHAYNYNLDMKKWQDCLDKGLAVDSTIAYLWQQKAMPYFKARKYEVGMEYIDKAVKYNPKRYLGYRAFIKCIFAKTYRDAIVDFEKAKELEGNNYVMDHTYNFYIALSLLQLNEFQKAEKIFKDDIFNQKEQWGEGHYLDLFYYGISLYEQDKWEEAIVQFDKSLLQYKEFADVKFFKATCLFKLEKIEEARVLYAEANLDAENGFSINEDNSIYETYPYQRRWK